MKLTLQLTVVVLIVPTKFRDNLQFTATVSQSLSTSCSTSFLARLVSNSRYYFIVSLLLFAFLSKRNGAPCNSAPYPGFILFLLAI